MTKPILAIALSFGHRGPLPGDSNEAIANLIKADCDRRFNFHRLSVQHEVGTALLSRNVIPDFQVFEHGIPGEYLNTLECIRQIIADWQELGIDPKEYKLWVYCHQIQADVIWMALAKNGIRPNRIITTNIYDPRSFQKWTRSKTRA